ncbi:MULTISPECIES: ABC transporter ATP-binding protein [Actibacterium]|uniref:Branched-chain amino acid transport system ATP-binding protein n=1 Tax=Actibacterium naphthalenivorans TaxID=1614693 RepID=A0A840C7M1_9RHOB|nr:MULTISPECIES: ABC transporter ATP-binding protein [Actibacterium]ALG89316.1 leucine/isoleucine/valine transporter ATP-binding subunit [Actibacterium sp. EMB200-NS6]MBB4021080.1 branched-chain amino acid transport system ATP-binding protein [Actibacterium naphthalenivorans]
MSNILEIKKLSLKIGIQDILHDISVTVPQQGIVSVLGANGVGKTSLMRCISGIYHPTGGQILLEGEDISKLKSHQIVDRGIMQAPEGRQIFSNMSVLENLIIGGGPLGRQELDHVLALFPRLEERLKQQAGSMSGGEQQMLCIGRALMRKPKVLLLDEPSLGLAPRLVGFICDLVSKIRSEGYAVLLVEQNVKAALRISDMAAVIEHGKIVIEGDAKALSNDPRVAEAYLGGHVHESA